MVRKILALVIRSDTVAIPDFLMRLGTELALLHVARTTSLNSRKYGT